VNREPADAELVVSWTLLLALAAGCYACKAVGLVVLGGRRLPDPLVRCLGLLPPAMLAALVMVQTFGAGRALGFDARVVGVAVGALAVWRRAPFAVVIVLAAATTAAIRAWS
jgi:branched-subunit amino acid transport protein